MKRFFYHTITTLLLVSITLGAASPAFAVSVDTFNPNYLLSDKEIEAWQSMTTSDIQAFLEEYDSFLATYQVPDKNGTPRQAADIIARAAAEHRINPKYILVKLQKEQSLIKSKQPTQKQLDWATGYGICDACSMDDPTLQKHKGFGVQVDSAAGIIRWYYDHVMTEPWIRRPQTPYTIDGIEVIPANYATAFLYTYTPHLEGNKNFWKLWQEWFDQIYPDGTLIKSSADPTIYVIQNKRKRAITSMAVLKTRFNPNLIITAPATELARYETGSPISYPNFSILREGTNYYLLDDDTLRPFADAAVVQKLGYHPDEIIDVTALEIADYPRGAVISSGSHAVQGRLIRLKENNAVYYIKENVYYPLYDEKIAKTNFPTLSIEKGSIKDIEGLTQGTPILFRDGTLIGITGSNKVYVVEYGKKRHIASEDVFLSLGYSWKNVVWTNELIGMTHETGLPISVRLEKPTTTPPVVLSKNNTTAPSSTAESNEGPKDKKSVMVITPPELTTYVGQAIDTPVDTYLIADYETGTVLAGKNIETVRPLASFTKVMTAYEAYKNGINESKIMTYVPEKHKALYGTFRVASGEMIRTRDLLAAMMVSSINTAAKMVVNGVVENEKDFITRMNSQAKEWGLSKTSFVDPAGVEVANQTTAKEFALLFKNILKDPQTKKLLAMKSYRYTEVLDLDGKPDHFDTHTNGLLAKKDLPFTILASKTGYLDEAGAGLVMLIERPRDKKQFIVITMGNPDYTNRFVEPEKIARYAIQQF
ncbi:MAG TPA: serine hydrolase [Candidatus Kapabacteria bacterium]|nr:serine hydrolase [Candidatus Kapabacteria bacterium]